MIIQQFFDGIININHAKYLMKLLEEFIKQATKMKEEGLKKKLGTICSEKRRDPCNVWSKLPEIVSNQITNNLSQRDILLAEMKFSMLINEVQYNKELDELVKLFRRYAMQKNDELPQFNRRHMVLILKRLKKYSDEMLKMAEENWQNPNKSICFNTDLMLPLLDKTCSTSYAMTCVAYVDMLDEMRKLIKRNTKKEELLTQVYSARINCEKILAPLQRLTSLRSTLRNIVIEEIDRNKLNKLNESLDNITGILDRCYEVLTSLHGSHYVADLDNILDFSLKLMSLKYKKKLTNGGCSFEEMPSIETLKHLLLEQKDSLLNMQQDLQKCNNELNNICGLSLSTTMSTLSSSSAEDKEQLEQEEDDDVYEFVDIPLIKESFSLDTENNMENKTNSDEVDRNRHLLSKVEPSKNYHNNEVEDHVYEEIRVETPISRNDSTCIIDKVLTKTWKDSTVVKESGLLDKLNVKEICIREAIYEIITSEMSYLKSLKKFIKIFYDSIDLKQCLSKTDFNYIFGNFPEVIKCSENFLKDMLESMEEDINLTNISNIVRTHAVTSFQPYIIYCYRYTNIIKLLDILKRDNIRLREILVEMENNGQTLQSNLVLPCQRVTRLPLLLQNVLSKELPETNRSNETNLALNALNKLAIDCDDAVRKTEHYDDLENNEDQSYDRNTRKIELKEKKKNVTGWLMVLEISRKINYCSEELHSRSVGYGRHDW